jgi:hypothetical protein
MLDSKHLMTKTVSTTQFIRIDTPLATLIKAITLLAVIALGLVSDVLRHDEASATIEYGYVLLGILAAAGCLGYLAVRFSSRLADTPLFGTTRLPHAANVASDAVPGEDWPLLISLLFGPLLVLLAGLGGWV